MDKPFWENKQLYVAPMVLQSELAFRLLCKSYNNNIVTYTPMICASKFVKDKTYRGCHFQTADGDRPLIAQFSGNNASMLIAAAKLVGDKIDAVDLNLGCPENIAKKGNYGSFLLKNTESVVSIVKQMVDALQPLPVTCKIRLLEYGNHIPESQRGIAGTIRLCQRLEKAGCSLICVHGRTRHNKGPKISQADFEAISQIKANVKSIPIIANGNISTEQDIRDCLKFTGADGVMSAEAILGNPSLYYINNKNSSTSSQKLHTPAAIANEYMNFVYEYPPFDVIKIVKPHLYRMLHGLFAYDPKLLEQLQKGTKNVNEYHQIVKDSIKLEQTLLQCMHGDDEKSKFISHLLSSYYYRHRPQSLLPRLELRIKTFFQTINKHDQVISAELPQQKKSQNERRIQIKQQRQKWIEFGVRISR